VGTPFPDDDMSDVPLVEDFYYARVYLNGFVWHNDSEKTVEYRAASQLVQRHYRKCAEIRVFSGLQQIIKPMYEFFRQPAQHPQPRAPPLPQRHAALRPL
jgi:hypothetical protein